MNTQKTNHKSKRNTLRKGEDISSLSNRNIYLTNIRVPMVKQTKFSLKHPEVWIPSSEEEAKKDIPVIVNLFKKFGKVKSVLDVGSGMGRHVYLLSKQGYACEGVEPHPAMVSTARKQYLGVTFRVDNMQSINYKNKFDAIICVFSTIVFNKSNEEVMKTFGNFHRALKKGGIAIIELTNPISWIQSKSFRTHFIDIDKEHDRKVIYDEWINTNNQSYVSTRTYHRLSDGKKVGEFTKESRMFFPLELKFFLESAGFEVLTMLSAKNTCDITIKDTKLNKNRLLVVAKKR